MKYHWLSLSAYLSFDTLKEALDELIIDIGEKYQINFA